MYRLPCFLKALPFVREMKAFTPLYNSGFRLGRMKLLMLQHLGNSPCRSLTSIRNAQVCRSANPQNTELGHVEGRMILVLAKTLTQLSVSYFPVIKIRVPCIFFLTFKADGQENKMNS